jgi:hypothetical protein
MRYVMTAALLCAAVPVAAQNPEGAPAARRALEGQVMMATKQLAEAQNVRIGVESKPIKGAPYSAEATTESVQALADGNRIVSKTSTRLYRDADGRTRRENVGANGADVTTISISDPVAGTTYVLDPGSRSAYRSGLIFTATVDRRVTTAGGTAYTFTRSADGTASLATTEQGQKEAAEGKAVIEMRTRVAAVEGAVGAVRVDGTGDTVHALPAPVGVTTFATGVGGGGGVVSGVMLPRIAEGVGKTTLEELGQQTIEGVVATGTRTTTEIPAGAIGNEQPIKIVSEQWFSPELQVLVMTRHSDPRAGETTYRLTGVVRAEPPRSLFEVPPDYTLQESAIRRQQER